MEEIALNKVIHPDLLVVNSKSKTKEEVIGELARRLTEKGYVSDAQAFIDDVYLREDEGVTGIGQGVAIPHGKSQAVKDTTVAMAVLAEPIEWETLDDEPVKVVIMFAVKDSDANTTHVLLLQQVAILLANDQFIQQVKQVGSAEELYQLVINFN